MNRTSSHQPTSIPTVAPSSFHAFSTPLARLAASTSAGKGYSDTNSRYPTASASITASTAPMTPCRLSLRSIRGYRANTSATAITAATPTSSGV